MPDQIRAFVKLLREFFRLQADVYALAAILEGAKEHDIIPADWRVTLDTIRASAEYRKTSEQFSSQLDKIEQSADQTDLEFLIRTIPQAPFLH